jgi:hypothetical protein
VSTEPGGISSKLGGFYEREFAAEKLLRIVAGRLRRLRWEPASGERAGADVELEHADGIIEHVQLKRQNRASGKWSVADLDHEEVLSAAARAAASGKRFSFVSADHVPHLKDICEQLRRSSDPVEDFVWLRVHGHKERRKAFEELLSRWRLSTESQDDVRTAVTRLRLMSFVQRDASTEGQEHFRDDVQATLTGDPETTAALLAAFLEERLGRDVLQQDVLEYLRSHGVRPRDLARDPSLPSVLQALRDVFRDTLQGRLIRGEWIRRPQVVDVLDSVCGPEPPRVVLVHGKPGVGKSGFLLGLFSELVGRGVPVLPLSLVSHPPKGSAWQYGESLGLHASPVAALRETSGERRAVLLLDQLDALRLTTGSAAATWQSCVQVLRDATADTGMVLVAACRTFDLQNDPNIRRWKEKAEHDSPDGLVLVEVTNLTPADVEPVLRRVGVEFGSLPPRLQHLLLHPNTLDAWLRLVSRGPARRDFATQTELLAELVDTLRREAAREHLIPDSEVRGLLERVREQMEKSGRLTVPVNLLDDRLCALDACCAVGLLVRSGGAVGFPHQSYFDHLVARAALEASGGEHGALLNWIKEDQTLQRRDQLRQLLFLLREEDLALAASVIERVLLDDKVRFHLKQLALGVLRETESVTSEDVELVVRLAASKDWTPHVHRLLWGATAWFDAAYTRGAWATWLRSADVESRLAWMRVALSVMPVRPEAVDDLVAPMLAEPGGAETLIRALPYDPAGDSPAVAQLRDRYIARGAAGAHDIMLNRVAEHDAVRVVGMVEAVIKGALRRATAPEPEERVDELRDAAFETKVASAVRGLPVRSFRSSSRLLRACERLSISAKARATDDGDAGVRRYRISSAFDSIRDVLTTMTAEAVAGLAECGEETLRDAIEAPQVRRSSGVSIAVARGLQRAPVSSADAAVRWLCREPSRLALRHSYERDTHGLAADIIRRHGPHTSPQAVSELEVALFSYWPAAEKDQYRWQIENRPMALASGNPIGQAQHLLLNAIPEERRSAAVRHRLALWDGKFGGPPRERPSVGPLMAGRVGSPIPEQRLDRLSDRQWLDIAARSWKVRRLKQVGPDILVEASPEHFANDFGQCAKRFPRRFVRVALGFSPEVPSVYFERLWDALADDGTEVASCEPGDLDVLLDRTSAAGNRNAISSALRVIRTHPTLSWGDAAWRLLETAVNHEEPRPGEYTVHVQSGGKQEPDVESTGLNCVRGAAASALAALAWNDSTRAARAIPLVRRLAADPHPAVRLAAAHAALGVYSVNKDEAVDLLLKLTSHEDDGVLSGHWLNELARYVRWSHPGHLESIFERMAHSAGAKVCSAGARWVTAEFFQRHGACAAVHHECVAGSAPQRLGVAQVLGQLLADESLDLPVIEAELLQFFDDGDSEVRGAAAGVFRRDGALQSASGPRLAVGFVCAGAFVDHSEALMWPLAHEALDLTPYAPAVFAAADRFAAELAPETRSIQYRLGLAGRDLSALLLRLYDAAGKIGDRKMAEDCLDRWDKLLANQVGDAEVHLESYDAS